MRRVPLWVTLIPLAIGIGGYWLIWQRFSEQFATDLARSLPGQTIVVGGFPYRLEAELDAPKMQFASDAFRASLEARRGIFNRGPWQPDLTVVRGIDAAISAAVANLADARITIRAPTLQASLRQTNGKIARLSMAFDQAVVDIGALRPSVRADLLELHLRERAALATDPKSPRPPAQLEGVVRAEKFEFDGGRPLSLSAAFTVNGIGPLVSYARWADGGTIEIGSLKLADTNGEILDATATAAPTPSGTLRINGTMMTVCPATVRAAFKGGPAPSEMRLRMPVRLAFGGNASALSINTPDEDLSALARRGQMPPCPALRR